MCNPRDAVPGRRRGSRGTAGRHAGPERPRRRRQSDTTGRGDRSRTDARSRSSIVRRVQQRRGVWLGRSVQADALRRGGQRRRVQGLRTCARHLLVCRGRVHDQADHSAGDGGPMRARCMRGRSRRGQVRRRRWWCRAGASHATGCRCRTELRLRGRGGGVQVLVVRRGGVRERSRLLGVGDAKAASDRAAEEAEGAGFQAVCGWRGRAEVRGTGGVRVRACRELLVRRDVSRGREGDLPPR